MDWLAIAQKIIDNNYITGVRSLCDDEQYEVRIIDATVLAIIE